MLANQWSILKTCFFVWVLGRVVSVVESAIASLLILSTFDCYLSIKAAKMSHNVGSLPTIDLEMIILYVAQSLRTVVSCLNWVNALRELGMNCRNAASWFFLIM